MNQKKQTYYCPVGEALGIFSGRWKPEILWHLGDKTMRFNQLQRAIEGVSQKMLTQQLRELERDGLVQRTQYPEIPPRVEYNCTALAHSLEPVFESLVRWGQDHKDDIKQARENYDRHQQQGFK